MLYTDSNVASPEVLRQLDGEVESVVNAASQGKGNAPILLSDICSQAWGECRSKLEAALSTFSTYTGTAGMQAHLAAVLNTGSGYGSFGARASIRLNQIIVNDVYYGNSLSPLQRWMGYAALRILFQEVANRFAGQEKGDRYEAKRDRYEKQEARLWQQCLVSGLPYVQSGFLERPGAAHGVNAGIWDDSSLSAVTDNSASAVGGSFAVTISYVDLKSYVSPTQPNNGESAASEPAGITLGSAQLLSVIISGLNPPSSLSITQSGLSQGFAPARTASAWNVYVGTGNDGAPMYLQNATPIPISQTSYTLTGDPVLSGHQVNSQVPDSLGNILFGNQLQRG